MPKVLTPQPGFEPGFSYSRVRSSTPEPLRATFDIDADIVIGISHQAHYRLLFVVCAVTPWIAAWSPWWIFIAEPADVALCVI